MLQAAAPTGFSEDIIVDLAQFRAIDRRLVNYRPDNIPARIFVDELCCFIAASGRVAISSPLSTDHARRVRLPHRTGKPDT